ncbi:MAG: hypothetical protein ACQESG_05550 [Nanobdellota archaeon]
MTSYEHMQEVCRNLEALSQENGLSQVLKDRQEFLQKVTSLQQLLSIYPWTCINREGFPDQGSTYDALHMADEITPDFNACVQAILQDDQKAFHSARTDYLNATIQQNRDSVAKMKEYESPNRFYEFTGRWVHYTIDSEQPHQWEHAHFRDLNNPLMPANKVQRLTLGPIYTSENGRQYLLEPGDSMMLIAYEEATYQKRRSFLRTTMIPEIQEQNLIITNTDRDFYEQAEILRR